jgi:succinoglycan biosynthesis transport protein ExoP
MTSATEAPPLQLSDLWAMVRRRRTAAMLAAAAMVAVVLMLPGQLMPTLYRAEATLTMGRGLKPVNFQSDQLAGLVPEQMVNTQRELITSKAVLEAALGMGGLPANRTYAHSKDPVALLEKRLRTSVIKNSWVIMVTLDDEDPVGAESGLRAVLDAYLAHQATAARKTGADDLAFIGAQLAGAKAKLEQARETERAFRTVKGIASTDPDRNHITARIQTLAERQAAIDERTAASAALLKQVKAADSIEDRQGRLSAYLRIDTISTLTVVGGLQQELFKLEGVEAELSAKYLDKHPKLIEVRSHMAAKRAQLEETINSARASIGSDHQVLTEQGAELARSQDQLRNDLNAYRENLAELQRLTLESQTQQKIHDEMLTRHAQLTALAGYDDRRMVVDAPPSSSPVPRGIPTTPLLALAVLAAIAAGVAGAALADAFDSTVRDARQVGQLTGVRLLGRVPLTPGLQPLCATGPAEPPALAEAMRELWVSLRFALGASEGCRIILVTSACDGDGRSTIAARLAASVALAGSRTLLVDGDLRQPTLAAQFGLAHGNGLVGLLAGEPELAPIRTSLTNLDLMPAGPPPANPGELLNSHCLPEWLALSRGHYDVVVIDAPAMLACSDALLLAGHADNVLLVVRGGRTGRTDLAGAWDRMEPLRGKVVGSVLIAGAAPT